MRILRRGKWEFDSPRRFPSSFGIMKLFSSICLGIVVIPLLLASCNTVKGVGRDVQSAGSGIQKGADKVERKMAE